MAGAQNEDFGKKTGKAKKKKKVIRNFGGSNKENFPEILAKGGILGPSPRAAFQLRTPLVICLTPHYFL